MRTIRWVVPGLIGLLMVSEILLSAATVFAQSGDGALAKLSPANQRIAQALFEAQVTRPPAGAQRLTAEQIAARRLEGYGWGDVFQLMWVDGVFDAQTQTLSQVMRAYNERHRGAGRGPGEDPSASPATSGGVRGR